MSEISAKMHVIDIKQVILSSPARVRKIKGNKKMRPEFCKLLKTHIEKMSVSRLSMMFMKTKEIKHSLHDVYEKKGEMRLTTFFQSREFLLSLKACSWSRLCYALFGS